MGEVACSKCGGARWVQPVWWVQIYAGQVLQEVVGEPVRCAACCGTGKVDHGTKHGSAGT